VLHKGLTRAIEAVESGVVSVPNGDAWRVIQALELMRRCAKEACRMTRGGHEDRTRGQSALQGILSSLGGLWVFSLTGEPSHAAIAHVLWEEAKNAAWCVLQSEALTTIRDVEAMTEVPRG